jgi:hypothetical protein
MITTRIENINGQDIFIATYGGIIDRVTVKAGSSIVSKFIWSAGDNAYVLVDVTGIAAPSERLLSLLEDHWVRAQLAPSQKPVFMLVCAQQHASTYRDWLLNASEGDLYLYSSVQQALTAVGALTARPA